MCSVGVRWTPGEPTWLSLVAIRDEFADRAFDDPGPYWPGVLGGRDRLAGGTWFAVDPAAQAVSILVNGPPPEGPPHPHARSRGELPLADLRGETIADDRAVYGNFYLVHLDRDAFTVRSHVKGESGFVSLGSGVHTITPLGVDDGSAPTGGLRETVTTAPDLDTMAVWLARQPVDGVGGFGTRTSVLIDVPVPDQPGRRYASVCAQLLQFGAAVVYQFTRTPRDLTSWRPVISA